MLCSIWLDNRSLVQCNASDEKLHCHICSKNFSSRWDLRWKEISKHEFVLLSKKCHWAICLGKNIMWIIFLGTTYSTTSNLFIRMKEGRTSTFLILIIKMIKKAQKRENISDESCLLPTNFSLCKLISKLSLCQPGFAADQNKSLFAEQWKELGAAFLRSSDHINLCKTIKFESK